MMTLFEISTIGSLVGSPVAGAIVGLRSGALSGGIGLAIGLVVGLAFHFGLCRFLFVLLNKAASPIRNEKTQAVCPSRLLEKLYRSMAKLLSETILYCVLLSPLLSIPLTVVIVGTAVGP